MCLRGVKLKTDLSCVTLSPGPGSEPAVEVLARHDEVDGSVDVDGVETPEKRQTRDSTE